MRIKISHSTYYSYTTSVFIEPQYIYMYPLLKPYIRLIDYQLTISPTPSGLSLRQDAEGNFYHQCWFNDMLQQIEIHMTMEVEVTHLNPFDFIMDDRQETDLQKPLQIYLSNREELSAEMIGWLTRHQEYTGSNTIALLSSLCTTINSEWNHSIRYGDHLLEPHICFSTKSGSCRDLSWMLIQLLRSINIPARFVSGYTSNPELEEGHELHAWVEAWLDGSGWIGIDPTAGIFTTEKYIPVAASFQPKLTLPVQGSYRGIATSQLDTTVKISEID